MSEASAVSRELVDRLLVRQVLADVHCLVIATMHKGEHGNGGCGGRAIDDQDDLERHNGHRLIVRRTHGPTLQCEALSQKLVLFSQQGS